MLNSISNPDYVPRQLHGVTGGRLFCRESGEGCIGIVGVIEVPANVATEALVPVRLNDRLWLDLEHPADPYERIGIPRLRSRDLDEYDAGNLLNSMKFAKGALPDAFEVFIRASHMVHTDPSRKWVIVVGAAHQRLRALPSDGLYELGSSQIGGVSFFDANIYAGVSLGQVLRNPIWGPCGVYGLATSMEPKRFHSWVLEDRARNTKHDPVFAAYIERMEKEAPMSMVYTNADMQVRHLVSSRVLREVMAAQDALVAVESQATGIATRPRHNRA